MFLLVIICDYVFSFVFICFYLFLFVFMFWYVLVCFHIFSYFFIFFDIFSYVSLFFHILASAVIQHPGMGYPPVSNDSCSLTITSLRSSLGSFWPRCGLSWFSSSRVVFQNSSEEHCGLSIPGLAIFRTAFSCILRRSFLGGLPCCLETKLPSKLHLNARERLERSYVFGVRPHCKSDTHPTILRSHGCFTHARTLQSSDSTAMSRCGKLLICWQRGPGQKQKNGCQLDTFSLFLFRFP